MDKLTEKGFVFLDRNFTTWRCAMWDGEPWLFRWLDKQKKWVSVKRVTQGEIFTYPHNLTEEEQALYFNN